MMKYLVRANWLLWDGILEAQLKHIRTEWSEVLQECSLDLLHCRISNFIFSSIVRKEGTRFNITREAFENDNIV